MLMNIIVRPPIRLSIHHIFRFLCICLQSTWKEWHKNGLLMYPDNLPSADIDADGYCCHFVHSSIRLTIHGIEFRYCRLIAGKKWSTFWHTDVSRWLAFSLSTLMGIIVHLFVCLAIWVWVWFRLGYGCWRHCGLRGISVAVILLTMHPSLS